MKKSTQKLLIFSGITFAGTVITGIVSHLTAKILVSTALDREMPKSMKNRSISKTEKNEELIAAIREKSEKLKNSDCKTVEIMSHDGEKLIGHWHHNDNDERIIIAMHGWRSSWSKDFGAISDFWHNNKCSVLYAEQRGQNDSGGDYMGFGMIERFDCLDWINWVNEYNKENLPIYLAGISMGASTVLMTSGFDLPENVHGIMADCGFTSANDIWKHVVENNMHLSYNMRRKIVNDLCKKKIQVTSDEYTTLDALATNTVPVLFVHGTDDRFVPIEMTYENYKSCNAPKRIFIVPGAAHAMSYMVDKDGYEENVKKFWHDYD